jgi:hypothetical protein
MSEWCGWPVVDDAAGWETAQQILTDAELSDGLPLVPPTRRRLEAMVAGVAGHGDSRGAMPPMFGDITPDSVAYQCVIAGCRPAELPVVLAAAEATLEPDFNLLGIATTTGTACVALCVHGPIARKLGINAGTNCLGPGNRANASIGRALQLCIRNIGGARRDGDMATVSRQYTFCFASNGSPFPTLTAPQARADASAIAIMGISAPPSLARRRRRRHAGSDPLAHGDACGHRHVEHHRRTARRAVFLLRWGGREDRAPRRLGPRPSSASCSTGPGRGGANLHLTAAPASDEPADLGRLGR